MSVDEATGTPVRVVRLGNHIGARIEGVRLGGSLDADTDRPDDGTRSYRTEFESRYFETEHPVVHVQPDTGERALLLGCFVKEIVGLSTAESRALFRLFQDRVTRLGHTTRWDWAPGDVAIWDNLATQHYAIDDYDGAEHRRLTRITLAGYIPGGADGRASTVIAGDAQAYSRVEPLPRAA
jgi:taurine dioxygenase